MKNVLTIASLYLLSQTALLAQNNVLTSPGFEGLADGALSDNGGTTQWGNYNDTAGNALIESSIVYSGTNAFELNLNTAGTAGFSLLYQNTGTTVPVTEIENNLWTYSFWVYTAGGSGSFNYAFLPSDSYNEDQTGASGTINASSLTVNTWTYVSGTFNTATTYNFNAGATAEMKANFSEVNGTGTFYIDNISLSPGAVPEPSAWTLAGLGFASLFLVRRQICLNAAATVKAIELSNTLL